MTDSADNWRLDGGGHPLHSRWSYQLHPPLLHLRVDPDGRGTLRNARGVLARFANPLEALRYVQSTLHADPATAPSDSPPFRAGWVGYLSYDLGRFFERLPDTARSDLPFALVELTWHAGATARDHQLGRDHRNFAPPPADAAGPIIFPASPASRPQPASAGSNFTPEAYQHAVARAVSYIAAGDIFQVNLAQRLTVPLVHTPAELYRRLRRRHGGWYGALLDFGRYALVSNSPELFLRVESTPAGRRVTTRPIKGTRPRLPGMDDELRRSLKDQAELNMIIDLQRNDLGRVCRIGSVRVPEPRCIEAHAGVYHGVGTITGLLRDDAGLPELLAATFPAGSITGAPKIRAMQILEELEALRRGPYCGAIGYFALGGAIELNVAIRTICCAHGLAHVGVGGGIVADSEPLMEYHETLHKAAAILTALAP